MQGTHSPASDDAASAPASGSATRASVGFQRLIMACVVALSIAAVGAANHFTEFIKAEAVDDAQADLARLNLVLSEQTASIFQSIDLVLADMASDAETRFPGPVTSSREQVGEERYARELRARRSGVPQIDGLKLVAADGVVVSSSRSDDDLGASVAGEGWFKALRDDPGLERLITAPIEETGAWKILIVRRIGASGGAFGGLVIGSITLDFFERIYHEVYLGKNIGVGLWRDDSTLIARYPVAGPITGVPNPAIAANHRSVLGEGVAGTRRVMGRLNPTALLLSVRRVRGYPLYMTVSLPEDAVIAQTRSIRTTIVVAAAISSLALCLIAVLGLRQWRAHRVLRDEAERRRVAEAQAKENEARFRDGIESMGDGFLLWDRNDRILTWNARFPELLPEVAAILCRGLSRGEFIQHVNDHALRHLATADRIAWQEKRRLNREQGRTTEVTNDAGRRIRIRDRRTSEGGIVSIYSDISDEHLIRQRIEAGEARAQRLALVAQHMHGAVLILDEKSRITWCNPAFTTLSGYDPEEAMGKTPRSLLFGPLTSESAAQSIAKTINAGNRLTTEMIYYRKDGATFDVEVDVSPILDSAGRVTGVIGVHIDVTERNRQAAALEQALNTQREVSAQQRRFISIVSHEFRTPITIIDGAAQVLQRKLGAEARGEIDTRLDRIRRAVSRMTELVERTLQSARLDEGRIEMRARRVDIGLLVGEACTRQRIEHPNFEIVVDLPSAPVEIEGDPILLDQVVTNLLSNAIKYSGDSRRIEVSLSPGPEGLQLRVRDYGIGVPADEVPRLFDRFYRAKAVSAIAGVGIGLHLVRELVAMHGGSVAATSEPGQGSTFTVRLPLAQPECDLTATG